MPPKFRKPQIPSHAAPSKVAAQVQQLLAQALALHHKGELAQTQALYEQILKIQPKRFDALHLLGVIAAQTRNSERAVELISRAIEINPNSAVAYSNLGNAFKELKQHEAAMQSFDRAIALKPDYAEAYCNRGDALKELKQLKAAVQSYDRAIALKPDLAEAYSNRGNALRELKQLDAAVQSYDRAIALKPDYAVAYYNRGGALKELKQLDAAVQSYDRAIALKPDYAEAYYNRGLALLDLRRHADAALSFSQLIMISPDFSFAKGQLLHAKMLCCDWIELSELYESVKNDVRVGNKSAEPFGYQAISDSTQDLYTCAKRYAAEKYPPQNIRLCNGKTLRNSKLRIGYLSGEFRNQATSILMTQLFELHDTSRFEIFAFDNGWDDGSELRTRIRLAFDEIVDITRLGDLESAATIRKREIDILVDLNGYFGKGRQGVFSYRPSPIQVNYLGFPGTIGAEYIDYLIADRTLIPEDSRQHYSEKIVYLPNSYQVNDTKRRISDRVFTRAELGLPGSGFVFCCFNNNYKITPGTFDGWMRILKRVEGSVLWLLEDTPTSANNLRREATQRNVSPDRLVFAKRMPLPEHLARHRAADLFLDTLPYNAHTTASDALWAGLPVLTCMGEAFASRVAASLLNAIDLPELITSTQEEYEALAVELATNPPRLAQIKQELAQNRLTTPLFDTPLFTKHIEAAYTAMYERYHADLPPDHIYVKQ